MARCFGHDYRSRCIYHITLKKARGVVPFGQLCGDLCHAGIARSQLGAIIEKHIRNLPKTHPVLKVLQYCIMPDHVHLLLFVMAPTDRHLGNYIGQLKVNIHQEYRELTGSDATIFENDFYDCILYRSRPLDVIFRYIRDNPRRLAVRRANPTFFRRVSLLRLGDQNYSAYGNIQLLYNPFKEPVVVHRADSPATRAANRNRWLHTAANGGVLVSPFISPAEKAVRTESEALGGRTILITNAPMHERYKPAAGDFTLSEEGRLLIMSPAGLDDTLSRRTCMAMNALAHDICTHHHTPCF